MVDAAIVRHARRMRRKVRWRQPWAGARPFRVSAFLALAISSVTPAPASAQCATSPAGLTIPCVLETAARLLGDTTGEAPRSLLDALRDPETLNRGLTELSRHGLFNGLLSGLNLEFVNLQQDEVGTVLGLGYEWARDLKHDTLMVSDDAPRALGIHFTASARGTIALEQELNPRDFVDSKVALALFGSYGGVVPAGEDAFFQTMNDLSDQLTQYETLAELEQAPEFESFFGAIWSRFSTQYYFTLSGNAGLESNQSFDVKQWTYGLHAGLDIKAWNPGSLMAQWNVFDWPAALVRYLSGADDGFRPSGAAIPTVILGIDQVDPTANPDREALSDLGAYPRVRLELAYRSMLAPLSNGAFSIEAGWRFYHELGADSAIEAADLDRFSYRVIAVRAPNGLYAAWSRGRLPFDRIDEQVYELGFQTNFW